MSRRIENWPPGLDRPVLWVRFRLIERWSVWHRRSSRTTVRLLGSGGHLTDCGVGLSSQIAFEEKMWTRIPDDLCCEVCLRHYLVAKVPPLGSPGGESIGRRGQPVIRMAMRRRRSNQPSV